jgi:hypothetical protein
MNGGDCNSDNCDGGVANGDDGGSGDDNGDYSNDGDLGRAVAQVVSRWLPTAAARVRVRAENVGFVMDKVTLGQVFSKYFGFPSQSSFHQFLYRHNHPGLAQ